MAVSAILNFGQFSSFDLDDIEGRVITLFKGFPGWGVHFWSYCLESRSKSRTHQRSKVKYKWLFSRPAADRVTGHARVCVRERACPKLECIWTRK